jgi:hypothetical protein
MRARAPPPESTGFGLGLPAEVVMRFPSSAQGQQPAWPTGSAAGPLLRLDLDGHRPRGWARPRSSAGGRRPSVDHHHQRRDWNAVYKPGPRGRSTAASARAGAASCAASGASSRARSASARRRCCRPSPTARPRRARAPSAAPRARLPELPRDPARLPRGACEGRRACAANRGGVAGGDATTTLSDVHEQIGIGTNK